MALGQVHHMNVVAHAGAVGRGVVVAKNAQKLPFAYGHLRDEGHEVVGNAIGVLAHGAANVRAHRVEVAQDCYLPQVWILGV